MIIIYSIITVLLVDILFRSRRESLYRFDLDNTYPLRGFLIILVVFHHLFREYPYDEISHITEYFGKFAVAGFFLMSGYGLIYSLRQRGVSYLDGFWKKKFDRIILYLCILTCFMMVLRYFYGGITEIKEILTSDLTIIPNAWYIYIAS